MSPRIVINIKDSALAAKPAVKKPVKSAAPAKKTKSAPAMDKLAVELKKLTAQFKEKSKAVTDATEALTEAKSALEAATKSADAVQAKIDKLQLQIGSANLAKAGVTFALVSDKKIIKKAKDLESALKFTPAKTAGDSSIIALTKDGKKSSVMVWAMKDPVTNRRFKGFSWFFVSEGALNKYGSPTTKRWLEDRKKKQAEGTLNPFIKRK